MAVDVLPDIEALLTNFYRDDPDVFALVNTKVFTRFPASFDNWPAVRLTRFGGTPPWQHPLVLDNPTVQVDVFDRDKANARLIIETLRAVTDERLPGSHPEGIIYAVDFGALSFLPDEAFDPALPRYLFDLTLTTRSLPV